MEKGSNKCGKGQNKCGKQKPEKTRKHQSRQNVSFETRGRFAPLQNTQDEVLIMK